MNQKTLFTWCDDLHQVKGNVSQLQATLNQILTKAPTLDEFRDLSISLEHQTKADSHTIAEKTKGMLNSSQLKVAMRLKHLYDQGKFPALLALSKINFKSSKADKFVGYFIDYAPPVDVGQSLPDVLKKTIKKDRQVDVQTYPPTLPPILNESLLIKVLTDKSYRQPSDFIESATANDFNQAHNAKLAIKGKTLMELALYDILEERFSDIHEDDLYLLRHKLLSNTILAKMSLGYNLIDQYLYNISNELELNDKLQILANIFLAYIAGLSLDGYSIDEITKWLAKLYEPIISELSQTTTFRLLNRFALSEISFLFKQVTLLHSISKDELVIDYKQLETDPYVAKLTVNGTTLGLGTSSSSFEEAKERAATEALKNKTQLDEVLTALIESFKESESDSAPKVDEEEEDSYSPRFDDDNSYDPVAQFNDENSEYVPPEPPMAKNENGVVFGYAYTPVAEKSDPQPYGAPPAMPGPQPYANAIAPYTLAPINPNIKNGVDNNAKNNLYALLGTCHLTPTYRFQKTGNDFQAMVLVNENILGVGYDLNKKIASQKAAMNALSNTVMLQSLGVARA